jgi:hypothetical protein
MAQEVETHRGGERRAAVAGTRAAERPQVIERRVVVPVVDEIGPGRLVYHSSIAGLAMRGGAIGAVVLGVLAWLVASGAWPWRDVGQFAAAGEGVAAFTGAGVGAAAGALTGALTALFRLPPHGA